MAETIVEEVQRSFGQRVAQVQATLKAPKSKKNTYSGFNYRSAEDILAAVNPLLAPNDLILVVTDNIVEVGGRIYVKATAILFDAISSQSVSAVGFAREADDKKGLDASQITGLTSSYARKYALGGLLVIDDSKDADTNEFAKEVAARDPRKKLTKALTEFGVKDAAGFASVAEKALGTKVPNSKALTDPQVTEMLAYLENADANEERPF
jgi:hypothetical protein